HPELVTEPEARGYDAVFAASRHWDPGFVSPMPLLQATNPARFNPQAAAPDSGDAVLFVGSTRGVFRPIVQDAIAAGIDLSLYGVGWQEYVALERIRAEFLANDSLPSAYAAAHVVLNDHHPHMAELGFLSNRLFDATATGTRVISDPALGLEEVFGGHVRTYRDAAQLGEIVADLDTAFPSYDERKAFAGIVAAEHSFAARAAELIAFVRETRAKG
ncbi:MAG: glycosyltransferase, partial [Candidatus Nanopelagicales bacterium]